jgi:ankyrin repeat protein
MHTPLTHTHTNTQHAPVQLPTHHPTITAADAARLGEVSALLKAGASVNARDVSGRTALTLCAKRGDIAALRLLLQSGADCNDKTFGSGETPLHAAILARATACVLELAAQPGIDVDWCVALGRCARCVVVFACVCACVRAFVRTCVRVCVRALCALCAGMCVYRRSCGCSCRFCRLPVPSASDALMAAGDAL